MPDYTVLKRTIRADKAGPPCVTIDEYSLDDGKTWISSKKYFDWYRNLVHVKEYYTHRRNS